jgi:PAS domain S-box-containing protein
VPGLSNYILAESVIAAPAAGAALGADDMKVTLLWAMVILAFGVLMMVCVLLLLKREPQELSQWDSGGSPAKSGRYLQHLSRLLRAIRAVNNVIISEREGRQLLQKACRTLTETRGYKMAWIGLTEPDSKRVVPAARAGFEEGYLEEVAVTWDETPTGRGPTGQAIKSGEPSVMRDIEIAPEFQPWRKQALERGYRSSAALPLRFENRVLGALSVYSEIPNAFDIEEIGLLQEVSDHLAYALGCIQLEDEQRRLRLRLGELQSLQAAFEHAPIGIIATDARGAITDLNPRAAELVGDRFQELAAAGQVLIQRLDFFSLPAAQLQAEKLFRSSEAVRFEQVWPAGGRRLFCHGVPVCAEGKLAGSVWMIQDVADLPQGPTTA